MKMNIILQMNYNSGNVYGKRMGHMGRNNPHVNHLVRRPVKAVFNDPNAYISPKDYSTPQLPTLKYLGNIEHMSDLFTG